MLANIDGATLAEAFPRQQYDWALSAGQEVSCRLAAEQWTERLPFLVDNQIVQMPVRLHFASHRLALPESDPAWHFACALLTRSNDGFERQRAARFLLDGPEPWAAPFIVALIGEYIVEILEDVLAAMTPSVEHTLGSFIAYNVAFWETTKRRIASYWNVYYRNGGRGAYRRQEYVGFKLADRLDKAAASVLH